MQIRQHHIYLDNIQKNSFIGALKNLFSSLMPKNLITWHLRASPNKNIYKYYY